MTLAGPARFQADTAPTPPVGPGEALVRVRLTGICGSDVHVYRHGDIGGLQPPYPFVLGHECMGDVVDTGPGVDPGLRGRRVAVEPHVPCGDCRWCRTGRENVCPHDRFLGLPPCHGSLQEYIVHPADLLEPLPDHVSDAAGVMLEPLAIALYALRLAGIEPGQRVVVLGAGVLGSCLLLLLGLRRDVEVTAVELKQDRLDRAQSLGARHVVRAMDGRRQAVTEAVYAATDGQGADLVLECAGAEDTLLGACDAAAPAGTVVGIGIPDGPVYPLAASSARRKGLCLRMVRRSLHTLAPVLRMVAAGQLDPGALVTHTWPVARAQDAFSMVGQRADGVLKVLLDVRSW